MLIFASEIKNIKHMKKYLASFLLVLFCAVSVSAQSYYGSSTPSYQATQQNATITFQNKSDYTMTLKVIKFYGGLYTTVVLSPHSSRTVSFGSTSTYKLKIKAVHHGQASYHDGGNFSVTCTEQEWTEGTMSFSLSIYGNGLGPSISAKEFESNK